MKIGHLFLKILILIMYLIHKIENFVKKVKFHVQPRTSTSSSDTC